MTITHLSPTRIRAIQYHDLRDALEDVGGAIPPDADQMTLDAIATLEARIWSLSAHVAQIKQTVRVIETCESRRGMHRRPKRLGGRVYVNRIEPVTVAWIGRDQ